MEKLLRLLKPKSINYEADRIDGGLPSMTAQDVLLAMSYAKLTPLQDNLIRLKCFEANSESNIRIFSKLLITKYSTLFSDHDIKHEYHFCVIYVALIEFCRVPADYVASCRKRAVIAGVEYRIIYRYLSGVIDMILKDFHEEFNYGAFLIFSQL